MVAGSYRGWASRTLEFGWLAAAVAVPLAFNPWGLDSFGLPKAALLRALVLLMLPAALLRAGDRVGNRQHRFPPLFLPTLALALVLLAATALSSNPLTSVFGRYERQEGLLTLAALIGLLLLTTANLEMRVQRERLWRALIWGSAPVVAYGLLQAVRLDPFEWQSDAASPVLSTLGRSNFVGSYLILVIPLTAARLALSRRRGWYILLLTAQLMCLALTQARAAWVGLIAASVALALLIGSRERKRILVRGTLVALVVSAAMMALYSSASALKPLQHLPGATRLADALRVDGGATAARLTIWRRTLELAAERPLLGYGPEMMRSVFITRFPPQLVYYQGREAVVDRAHNVWLDWLMIAGAAGVVAIAVLWVAAGRVVWQGLGRATDVWERALLYGVAAALIAHLVDLQFSFDVITTMTTFLLVIALGVSGARVGTGETAGPAVKQNPGKPLYLIPPAAIVLALVWLVSIRPLLADHAFWESTQQTNTTAVRLAAARNAVSLWPTEPAYRLGLSQALAASGDFAAGEEQVRAMQQMRGDDAAVWIATGQFYAAWGERDAARWPEAEAAYWHAIAMAPDVSRYHLELGQLLARLGRWDDAAAACERAVALDATDVAAYQLLAQVYRAQGRDTQAAWARDEAAYWAMKVGGPMP